MLSQILFVSCHRRLKDIMLANMARPSLLVLLVHLCFVQAIREDASCQLKCENGGVCEYLPGLPDDQNSLARKVQAGQMIQRCSCPEGFSGTGCELPSQQCNIDSMTCENNSPCEKLSEDTYSCNCAVADQISRFAARQCRIPYTEYCSDRYDPDEPLSFCTNGGKCKAGIIAAKISPGNTTLNSKYQNAGCVCPPEYYGPHCEFLHQQRSIGSHSPKVTLVPSETTDPPLNEGTVPGNQQKSSGNPSQTIEEMINGYDGGNKSVDPNRQPGSTTESSTQPTTFKILFTVLGIVMVGFIAVIFMVRRTRKKRALEFTATIRACDRENRRSSSKILKKAKVSKSARVSVRGALDTAYDESTMKTARTDVNSHSDQDDSLSGVGWVDALSGRLDAYVGHYVVDDDEEDDDLYPSNAKARWGPIDRGLHSAYLVGNDDDDDDDIISTYSGRDAGQFWNATIQPFHEKEIL